MRILHVAEAFGGGLLEVVRSLAEGAVEEGHAVAIAYGFRPETPSAVRHEIAPPVELFPVTAWNRRTPAAQFAASRTLSAIAAGWRPDVVHLHSSFAGLVGGLALGATVPTVFSPHAYASALPNERALRRAVFRVAERVASRRVALVGAVSHSEERVALEEAGARRVVVVENGIPELDAGQCVERERPDPALVIAAGRTVPQRQPVACARILSRVADVASVAWVGGGGGSRGTEGYAALEATGIRPSGWLPRQAVLDRLREASAYLHWTSWDGQPLSVLEAMAMDAVVVASDTEPNREILARRQVCATEDEAVSLLRRIVLDRDFAQELVDDQRTRRLRYGSRRMVEEWLAVYACLAAQSHTSRA